MENTVRRTLSNSNPVFYPPSAIWITCKTLSYRPHFNECSVRTILALIIQALHPTPMEKILLPLMHKNLPLISQTWIGTVLLHSELLLPTIWQWLHPMVDTVQNSRQMSASWAYLIPWDSSSSPFVLSPIENIKPRPHQGKPSTPTVYLSDLKRPSQPVTAAQAPKHLLLNPCAQPFHHNPTECPVVQAPKPPLPNPCA